MNIWQAIKNLFKRKPPITVDRDIEWKHPKLKDIETQQESYMQYLRDLIVSVTGIPAEEITDEIVKESIEKTNHEMPQIPDIWFGRKEVDLMKQINKNSRKREEQDE